MSPRSPVERAALDVLAWMRARDWVGVDPFDGLRSPLAAPVRRLRWPAVAWIQLHRRLPVDLRPLVGVRPHTNPKALSLTLQGVLALQGAALPTGGVDPDDLLTRLLALEAPGGGWGYPFAWANRHFLAPAGTASSVVTAFVGGALLDAREVGVAGDRVDEAVRRGAAFVVRDLNRVPAEGGFLFSYTPVDDRGVHNASVLAAAFLARTARLPGGEAAWTEAARAAAGATLAAQRADGSWPYGTSRRDDFVDSFHTGYVLSALRTLDALGVVDAGDAVARGLDYWRETFVGSAGVPHRPDRPHPVDFHAVAQGILTCLEFRDLWPGGPEHARRLAAWALAEGQGADGSFDYLWWPRRSNRVRYLRWVQAWMFRALATLSAQETSG